MHFQNRIWVFHVFGTVLLAISESTIFHPPGPIRVSPGNSVNFTWTSTGVKILEATWGIRGGVSTANPQYIFVRATNEFPVVDSTLPPGIKSRIHYIGNLTAGRAWFSITNVEHNDSNTYIALIREDGSSTQPYYMQVIVELPTTAAPTISSTSASSTSTSSTPTSTSSTTKGNTATITTAPHTSEKGLSVKAKIGIGVGVSLGVIGIIIAIWVVYIKCIKKSQRDNHPADKKEDTEMNSPPAVNA